MISWLSARLFDIAGFPRAGLSDMPWTWWALQIGTPIVALIGVTGNILSFLVLKSKRYRYKSYSHYLCTLAVFDSFVLVFKYIKRLNSLLWHTGHDGIFAEYGDAACKVCAPNPLSVRGFVARTAERDPDTNIRTSEKTSASCHRGSLFGIYLFLTNSTSHVLPLMATLLELHTLLFVKIT